MQETRDVLSHPAPGFSADEAAGILEDRYGITGELRPLVSERDQNFRVLAGDGSRWVLKIANAAEAVEVIDFQTAALAHIEATDPALPVPRVRRDRDGRMHGRIERDGHGHAVHLLSWLDGTPIDDATRTPALRRDIGRVTARLGLALRGFFHRGAGRSLLWDLKELPKLEPLCAQIGNSARRKLAEAWFGTFRESVAPRLPTLRAQVIHNDCNRDNVIVDGDAVSGIIDFGDMLHGPLACDLAVTAAYQVLGAGDIVAAAADVAWGYDEQVPLEAAELELLPELIASRLLASAVICDWRGREHPENRDYILDQNDQVWDTLAMMSDIDRGAMRGAFRGERQASARDGRDALLERRRAIFGDTLRLFYDEPLEIVRGEGAYLYDAAGRDYLDCYNNVAQVGHAHPAVVAALSRQARTLNTNTRYLHGSIVSYAERLADLLPGELGACLFVCTGSEANDLALQMARCHTGNRGAIVTEFAYHGNTIAVAQLSPEEMPGDRRESWVQTVPRPDTYRGTEGFDRGVGRACAQLAGDGHGTAALFLDSIFASDGIYTPPPTAIADAVANVRAAGGLYVADEVQAGFGRCAPAFWGFGRYGVVPDIVTLGKPMGNGHPLAAVVTTPAIAASFARQQGYFNTFGGNPVSAAVGHAVLNVIEREGLVENAAVVGTRLIERLRSLGEEHEVVGDVRGAGLFLGVELVSDRDARIPLKGAAKRVMNAMRRNGVLAGATGQDDNVLKLRPPLALRSDEADRLLDALDGALRTLG